MQNASASTHEAGASQSSNIKIVQPEAVVKKIKRGQENRPLVSREPSPCLHQFTIRDKGKEQYQYLISFKENKTPGLNNTAVKSLLPADQVSYDDSIRNPDRIVKKISATDSNGNELSAGQQAYLAGTREPSPCLHGKIQKESRNEYRGEQ